MELAVSDKTDLYLRLETYYCPYIAAPPDEFFVNYIIRYKNHKLGCEIDERIEIDLDILNSKIYLIFCNKFYIGGKF